MTYEFMLLISSLFDIFFRDWTEKVHKSIFVMEFHAGLTQFGLKQTTIFGS